MTDTQDDSEPWVAIEAVVATSHRVEKYGGVQLAESALQQIADALNTGAVPLLGQHDWTQPIRSRDLEASIITLPDGEKAVRMVGLVHQGDWESAGQFGGMSFTTFETLGVAQGPHSAATEAVSVAADAGWFADADIAAACEIICPLAPAQGSRLLQFSAADIARISLEVGLTYVAAWGPGIAQSAIWDGLKHLMLRRLKRKPDAAGQSPTRIELVTKLPGGSVVGVIDTNDPEVVKSALAAYSGAVDHVLQSTPRTKQIIVWGDGEDGGSWAAK